VTVSLSVVRVGDVQDEHREGQLGLV